MANSTSEINSNKFCIGANKGNNSSKPEPIDKENPTSSGTILKSRILPKIGLPKPVNNEKSRPPLGNLLPGPSTSAVPTSRNILQQGDGDGCKNPSLKKERCSVSFGDCLKTQEAVEKKNETRVVAKKRRSISFSGPSSKVAKEHEETRTSEILARTESKLPVRKPVVRKKSSLKRGKKTVVDNWYTNCLYDDYLNENFLYSLHYEDEFVLKIMCLRQKVYLPERVKVVDWMVHIQQVLDLWDVTLFSAVRMLDYALIHKEKNHTERCYLIAITALWIASKFYDSSRLITTKQLIAVTGGKFTTKEFLRMERYMLTTILNWRVNFPEPTFFLYKLMCQIKMEGEQFVRLAATFYLECNMLHWTSSATPPSQLACCALRLVLRKLGYTKQEQELLDFVDDFVLPAESVRVFSDNMDLFFERLLDGQRHSLKNILKKYSSVRKLGVADHFGKANKSQE